ncbi:hypothetical protein A0H81_13452 [Grifola frondosa]|uniref:Uncharacterized protein n=1 Tax=Grifola frondosa TaxID=5627 RepID=A0A1C7LPT7_GRIFR|nr:hypothetical protein A0H81_13452 [Grifola frondosa]
MPNIFLTSSAQERLLFPAPSSARCFRKLDLFCTYLLSTAMMIVDVSIENCKNSECYLRQNVRLQNAGNTQRIKRCMDREPEPHELQSGGVRNASVASALPAPAQCMNCTWERRKSPFPPTSTTKPYRTREELALRNGPLLTRSRFEMT